MSVTDQVKTRLDLVAYIIDQGVNLKRAGRSYKALCPFHQERTPSFVVFPETQTWRCFGSCNEGGDIFNFAMKQHGWDFSEALRELAKLAGVELEERTPQQQEQEEAYLRQIGLLDETARFFNDQLLHAPDAAETRAYLQRRQLNDATVEQFTLGYAPDGWHAALDHLKGLGYSQDDIVASGVAIRNDQGRVYDRFRHRLVIPIRDGRGRTIGFGARALRDEDMPKYLNSPQSELFDKSHTLFGLDLARRDIRETETAVIVEGYMDVMQAHQAGFRNVVAQMGTALTKHQLQLLRKYASRIVLALDADQAGLNATMRGLDVARQALDEGDTALLDRRGAMRRAVRLGIDMRVLIVTEGKDPDDLIRRDPDEWRRLVERAEPVADFVIRMGTQGLDPRTATTFEKEKVARELLPLLTATESDLHREANVQKLALALHLPERRLMEIARESRAAAAPPQATNPNFRERRRTQAMDQALTRRERPPAPQPKPTSAPPTAAPAPADWQEGPPRDLGALLPPEEDDDEDAAYRAPLEPDETPRVHLAQVSAQERYFLGALLSRPELLYQANRALALVADAAVNVVKGEATHQAVRDALGSVTAADFLDPVHQDLFARLEAALMQDDLEPLAFVQQGSDAALRRYIDDVITEPLAVYSAALPDNLRIELASVLKQQRKTGRTVATMGDDLVENALLLRRARLGRACDELYFLIQEQEQEAQPGNGTANAHAAAVHVYRVAIVHLDRELKRRA